MYKVELYCDGCKTSIDDRQFLKSRVLTLEKFQRGPWMSFTNPSIAQTVVKIALCPECLKKIDAALNGNLSSAFDNPTEKEMEEYFNENTPVQRS